MSPLHEDFAARVAELKRFRKVRQAARDFEAEVKQTNLAHRWPSWWEEFSSEELAHARQYLVQLGLVQRKDFRWERRSH